MLGQGERPFHNLVDIDSCELSSAPTRKRKQLGDDLAATAGLRGDGLQILQVLATLVVELLVLQPAHQDLGVGDHARQWVVDLVRDHRCQPTQRSHAFDLHDFFLSPIELAGLLVDPLLQGLGPAQELGVGRLEVVGHAIEGSRQRPEFVAGHLGHACREIPVTELGGLVDQLLHRAVDHPLDPNHGDGEHHRDAEEAGQQEIDGTPPARLVVGIEAEVDVEHSEQALRWRMSVAGRIRAVGLVTDHLGDSQHPSARTVHDAGPLLGRKGIRRFDPLVAAETLLLPGVENAADFLRLSGEGDLAPLLHHSNALDLALIGHRVDGLLDLLAIVVQHRVAGGCHHQVAELGTVETQNAHLRTFLNAQVEPRGKAKEHDKSGRNQQGELTRYGVPHPSPPAARCRG